MKRKIFVKVFLGMFLLMGILISPTFVVSSKVSSEIIGPYAQNQKDINGVATFEMDINWDNPTAETDILIPGSFWMTKLNPFEAEAVWYVSASVEWGQRLIGKWEIKFYTSQGHNIWKKDIPFDVALGPNNDDWIKEWQDSDVGEWDLSKPSCTFCAHCWAEWERYEWKK